MNSCHEFKTDLLRIWIPLATGGAMLIGMFAGMEIQGCRDSGPPPLTQASPPRPFCPRPQLEQPTQSTLPAYAHRDGHPSGSSMSTSNFPCKDPLAHVAVRATALVNPVFVANRKLVQKLPIQTPVGHHPV